MHPLNWIDLRILVFFLLSFKNSFKKLWICEDAVSLRVLSGQMENINVQHHILKIRLTQ